ncbi:FecR family protein [Sphingobacterium sp. SRCM116780]|uniref:FecR family protein n=1 Tax=Sphingobacterium sp. SRCM116780 TaxID=2907623 RepID=UPI001F26C8A4|nr:FecR family protein [Sphingobacterium sp. SRCM116780]UIR56904.1 FecR family protein [Sphingobacterium sp. SRCM116780]
MDKEDFLKLLSKKMVDGLSKSEQCDYDIYLAENQDYEPVTKVFETFYKDVNTVNDHAHSGLDSIWSRIENESAEQKIVAIRPAKVKMRIWGMTAAIIVFFIATTVLYQRFFTQDNLQFEMVTKTGTGEKLLFSLDDGSQITLDRNSSISYNKTFGASDRDLLLNGTAFFDVAKDTTVPMNIRVGDWNIRVVGTSFMIRPSANAKESELVLYTGKVQLSQLRYPEKVFHVLPNQKVKLVSNEKGAVDLLKIDTLDAQILAMQKMNLQDAIVFKNQKFKDIQRIIERKYQVKLIFANKLISEKKFSGTLKDMQFEELLQVLKISYPFKYEIKNKEVTIR